VRTTVNLDDDVLLAVQERARREKRTVGQVLSELARRGLMAPQPHPGGETADPHGFRPLTRRGRAVSNALIDLLLEDEPE